jgi:hypothetical protein
MTKHYKNALAVLCLVMLSFSVLRVQASPYQSPSQEGFLPCGTIVPEGQLIDKPVQPYNSNDPKCKLIENTQPQKNKVKDKNWDKIKPKYKRNIPDRKNISMSPCFQYAFKFQYSLLVQPDGTYQWRAYTPF